MREAMGSEERELCCGAVVSAAAAEAVVFRRTHDETREKQDIHACGRGIAKGRDIARVGVSAAQLDPERGLHLPGGGRVARTNAATCLVMLPRPLVICGYASRACTSAPRAREPRARQARLRGQFTSGSSSQQGADPDEERAQRHSARMAKALRQNTGGDVREHPPLPKNREHFSSVGAGCIRNVS